MKLLTRLSMVCLALLLMTATSEAQRGGGGMGGFHGGGGFNGGGGFHGGAPMFRGNPGLNRGFRPGFNPSFRPGFNPGFGRFHSRPIVIAPAFPYDPYPYYSYPYDSYPYDSSQEYVNPEPAPPSSDSTINDLTNQVQQLNDQVQQLQDQLAASRTPPPAPEVRPSESTPTVLVFRNGRRIETQNYAIAGQTLWVMNKSSSSRFPLSDLDLAATRAENLKRGINFSAP